MKRYKSHPQMLWWHTLWMACCWIAMTSTTGIATTSQTKLKKSTNAEVKPLPQKESLLSRLLAPGPLSKPHLEPQARECTACHEPWGGVTDAKCFACHKPIEEARKKNEGFHGQMKMNCATCHTEHLGINKNIAKFDERNFDHDLTGFPLKQKHQITSCKECHQTVRGPARPDPFKINFYGQTSSCLHCHQQESDHFYPEKWAQKECSECHSFLGWEEKNTFDHAKDAKYELKFKHKELKCKTCHTPMVSQNADLKANHRKVGMFQGPLAVRYEWSKTSLKKCIGCHDNPHEEKGIQAKHTDKGCLFCHEPQEWKMDVKGFDHKKVGYDLKGVHLKTDCLKCHEQEVPKVKKPDQLIWTGLKTECRECHESPHAIAQTDTWREKPCGLCHTHKSFADESLAKKSFNHDLTQFPLLGAHKKSTCKSCHRPGEANQKEKDLTKQLHVFKILKDGEDHCTQCHQDPHNYQIGTQCLDCHNNQSWEAQRDFHQGLKLTGTHLKLNCSSCHQADKPLAPVSQNCSFCHGQEEPHRGALTACSSCHLQHNWQQNKFRHNATGFPLIGAHGYTSCASCHSAGIYKGTPKTCATCHLPDASQVREPVHVMPAFQNCNRCHTQFGF